MYESKNVDEKSISEFKNVVTKFDNRYAEKFLLDIFGSEVLSGGRLRPSYYDKKHTYEYLQGLASLEIKLEGDEVAVKAEVGTKHAEYLWYETVNIPLDKFLKNSKGEMEKAKKKLEREAESYFSLNLESRKSPRTMQVLIEDLGRILNEGSAKKKRKRKAKKRSTEADMNLARQIGAAMKTRVAEIERLLPMPWKFESPLELDKSIFKSGDAYMYNTLQAEHDWYISHDTDTATAEFAIGCYSYGNGEGVVCGASVSDIQPYEDYDEDPGMDVENYPKGAEIDVEVEWKRGKKAFDPSKDLWPLLKATMKKLKEKMPEYNEWYIEKS